MGRREVLLLCKGTFIMDYICLPAEGVSSLSVCSASFSITIWRGFYVKRKAFRGGGGVPGDF